MVWSAHALTRGVRAAAGANARRPATCGEAYINQRCFMRPQVLDVSRAGRRVSKLCGALTANIAAPAQNRMADGNRHSNLIHT